MNIASTACLVLGMLLQLIADFRYERQQIQAGSLLTRTIWSFDTLFFMLAAGLSGYTASLSIWLRVPLAIVLGVIMYWVWAFISSGLSVLCASPYRNRKKTSNSLGPLE